VCVDRTVGWADWPQTEVVGPTDPYPIELFYDCLRILPDCVSPAEDRSHSLIAQSLLGTGCNTASTGRLLVVSYQFRYGRTRTARSCRLECGQAPIRPPEATAVPCCFFGAMTLSRIRWWLDPRYLAPVPPFVRFPVDARRSRVARAGESPVVF
jgi:hypothetical protein